MPHSCCIPSFVQEQGECALCTCCGSAALGSIVHVTDAAHLAGDVPEDAGHLRSCWRHCFPGST